MDTSTLANITAYGSLATPVVLAVLSAGFLVLRLRWEASRRREEDERAAARKQEEDERAAARKQEDDARARAQRLEDEMRQTRMELGEKILVPFFDALNAERQPAQKTGWLSGRGRQPRTQEIDFAEFRRVAFRLSLYGDDDVVKALNDFMQLAYSMEPGQNTDDPSSVLKPLGRLLLAIRKSAGNEDTDLGELEVLEWMISDLRKITSEGQE